MVSILVANTDFFKKPSGILKICELVLGMIVLSLAANYSLTTYLTKGHSHIMLRSECFILIASCTFFLGTLLIILSSVFSVNTESRLRQTLFEPMYHFVALVLYFSGSVAVLANGDNPSGRRDGFLAAGGIGIITSVLYGVSAYDSYRAYVTE